jgi:OmpA-OmpF porin, OOP family
MSNFLIDAITDVLRSGSLGTVASQLGQSEQQVTRGLQMGVASIGAGLASKTQDRGFMRALFDLATTRGVDPARVVSDPTALTTQMAPDSPATSASNQFLSAVFGNNVGAVTSAISGATGLRPDSTTSLLGMAGSLVLGVLGSRVRTGGLTASGFTDWLASQRDSLLREAPPALRGIFGAPATVPPAATRPIETSMPTSVIPPRPRSDRWLWPAIAAILVLGVLWNVLRGNRATMAARNTSAATDTATAAGEVSRSDTSMANAPAAAAAMVSAKLPNGVELRVPDNGMETKLLAYLQDPSHTGKDTTWFDMDRLLFETNSATLAPSSQDQLHDVAEILKAYPKAHATIGGYTDNTGDADANMRLSAARATSVVSQLTTLGVPGNRLTAKGYGDAHPVADNATAVGRAQNRRIAIRITSMS